MKLKRVSTFIFAWCLISQICAQQWTNVNESLGNVSDVTEFDGKIYTISNLGLFSVSEDNGENWTIKDIRNVSTLDNPIFMTIAFFDDKNGIIGIRNPFNSYQLLSTADSGDNWAILEHENNESCSTGFMPLKITVVNDTTAVLVPLNAAHLRVTKNRGSSWECINSFISPSALQKIEILNEKEWFYNDNAGLNYTDDGGQTWKIIKKNYLIDFQICPDSVVFGLSPYYDSPNGIPIFYSSKDNFATYDSISLDIFSGEFINLFLVTSENEIFMIIGDKAYFSKDQAQSFKLIQEFNNEPIRTHFINDKWYLSGRGLWELDPSVSNIKHTQIANQLFFPNPVIDEIKLNDNQYEYYNIISIDGKTIASGTVQSSAIDVTHLQSGMYFLQLSSEKSFVGVPFIK
ncbi:T9SS type A sorting domain-containing protein [Portibacter lacus]|nr:T9SS type A sorting domain-containing protein [Portibacter lacus]